MESLWWLLLACAVMLAYIVFLVRASMRGKQWAIDTLSAIACMSDGSAAASAGLVREVARQRAADAMRRARTLVA